MVREMSSQPVDTGLEVDDVRFAVFCKRKSREKNIGRGFFEGVTSCPEDSGNSWRRMFGLRLVADKEMGSNGSYHYSVLVGQQRLSQKSWGGMSLAMSVGYGVAGRGYQAYTEATGYKYNRN